MLVGVSSYSYCAMIRDGRLQEAEIPALAREMGFGMIEFSNLTPPEGEEKLAYAARIRGICDKLSLVLGNYAVGADFLKAASGSEAEIRRLQAEVDVAAALGAPSMRHDVTAGRRGESFDQALPQLAACCRAVTEYAAARGIRTMTENHGFFCQDSERVEKLITAVNHPNYGALVDIGNFLCVDEDPVQAVARLTPYAFHVHAKDFLFKSGQEPDPGERWFATRGCNRLRGAIIGHGIVPVRQCLQILRRAGYDGTLSIEFEGLEDPLIGVRLGLQNLQNYLA